MITVVVFVVGGAAVPWWLKARRPSRTIYRCTRCPHVSATLEERASHFRKAHLS